MSNWRTPQGSFAPPPWLKRASLIVGIAAGALLALTLLSNWLHDREAAIDLWNINREVRRGSVAQESAKKLTSRITLSLHTLIFKHRWKTGSFPGKLNALVADQIAFAMPLNPYSGKPMQEVDLFADSPGDYTYFVSQPSPPLGQEQTFLLLIHGESGETLDRAAGWGMDLTCFPPNMRISNYAGSCDLAGKSSGIPGIYDIQTLPTGRLLQQCGVPMTSEGKVKVPES